MLVDNCRVCQILIRNATVRLPRVDPITDLERCVENELPGGRATGI